MFSRSLWAMLALALFALLTNCAHAFCSSRSDGSKCHPQIVRESLPFLRPGILDTVANHVNDPDEAHRPTFGFDQWRRMNYATADHFENCNFDGGAEVINDRYLRRGQDLPGIVEALSPLRRRLIVKKAIRSSLVDEDYPAPFEAARQWAWVLHAAQDLYSHSNWVELGFTDPSRELVDPGWDSWAGIPSDWRMIRGDVIGAQAPLPAGWKIEYLSLPDPAWPPKWADDADTGVLQRQLQALARQPKLGERIPFVTDASGKRFRLLISGHGPVFNPWNTCPLPELIHHDDLSKDNKTRRWHAEASKMAVGQTKHEWCRLLNLAQRENSPAGAAVLMGLMVNPGESPHPAGSVCAPAPAGTIELVARVTRILVHDDREANRSGPRNFVFAGFTPDFRRSARAQISAIAVDSGPAIPADRLPQSLRFCLNPSEPVVLTVQGWKDVGASPGGELDEADGLLAGATGTTPTAGQLVNQSKAFVLSRVSDNEHRRDLEITIEISARRLADCQARANHRTQGPDYAK
jgi:hypothetical protein